MFNLAFGDIDTDGGIDDYHVTDNGDRNKILATVANAVDEFTRRYPMRWVYFRGSTEERTRLYRMAVDYIKCQKTIDTNVFFNFIGFLRNNGLPNISDDQKKAIEDLLNILPAEKEAYRLVMRAFCFLKLKVGSYSPAHLQELIDRAASEAVNEEEEIKRHIAYAYVLTDEIQKAKVYIESYLDYNKYTESYALYCKIKFNSEGEKASLLPLLKKHREEFPVDIALLQMELNLIHLQGNIKEAIKVARKGIELFPSAEYFVRNLFILLNSDVQIMEIRKAAHIATGFPFIDEDNVAAVAQILIRAEMYQEARDLLYRYAVNPSNSKTRQAYFFHSHLFPKGLFNEFDTVEPGMIVKYEINGSKKFIEITEQNQYNHPYKLFVGKKTGEAFSYQKRFGSIVEMGRVVRVMDKYLGLFEEIMEEANDPLSALPMQQINFNGDNIETLNQEMVKAFGLRGTLHKEWADEQLERYYSGATSFGEITKSVFGGDPIDAYFLLTNNNGKPFKAISRAFGRINFPDEIVFVLDVTSLCLFYLLTKECDIYFKHKFLVSPFMRQAIVTELEETKNKDYGISLSITMDGVHPHVYDDGFKDRRLDTFRGLLQWLDDKCLIADVPERLNFVTHLGQQSQNDFYINIMLDNRLLIDRPGHYLLTNDYLGLRSFTASPQLAVSPVCYLEVFHSEKRTGYINHMLQKNYVGIPISADLLSDEFFKMLSGKENRFTMCLENLKFNWNPETKHINEAVTFIKNMYVSSYVSENSRDQCTTAVLHSLTRGMDRRLLNIVRIIIMREFRLLGHHELLVLDIFQQVSRE